MPGGPETDRRFALIAFGLAEWPWSAARKASITASKDVPSYPVTGYLLSLALNSFANAPTCARLGESEAGAVPRSPTVACCPTCFRDAGIDMTSVISVFEGDHLPVRTRAGPTLAKVAG